MFGTTNENNDAETTANTMNNGKNSFSRFDLFARKHQSLISLAVKIESNKMFGIKETYSVLKQSREYLLRYEPKSVDELPARSMQDSFTSALIPLGTDNVLQDKYVTFLGSVRLGRLMEDMDQFAVWVVQQHVHIPNLDPSTPLPYTFVTLLVDKISFTDVTPKVSDEDIQWIRGHLHRTFFSRCSTIKIFVCRVTWAGSVEVRPKLLFGSSKCIWANGKNWPEPCS